MVHGLLANPNLVNYLNTLYGKQVLVEIKAGQQFVGVFGASSPEMDIGLSFAYMKTTENGQNILPMKDEIKEKMVFKFADVICVSALWNEEKTIKGFATDRDYHAKTNGRVEEDELEEWECEEEGVAIEDHAAAHMPDQRQAYHKSGGWSVHEMFHANSRLHGVQSTFAEDMSQYTTVDFEGTEEERARAEQIAREIEQNSRSNFYSRLENDDDERDLDKETNAEDLVAKAEPNRIAQKVVEEEYQEVVVIESMAGDKEHITPKEICAEVGNGDISSDVAEQHTPCKKFAFNPNAPVFTPRIVTPSPSEVALHLPPQMMSPLTPSVPPGMVIQPQPAPPGWNQGFVQVQSPQYMVPTPQRGIVAPSAGGFPRHGGPPQVQLMPNLQWQNAYTMNPMAYYYNAVYPAQPGLAMNPPPQIMPPPGMGVAPPAPMYSQYSEYCA